MQGSYALMDRDYMLNLNAQGNTESPFKHSLFILTTVTSTAGASRGWVTLDAGPYSRVVCMCARVLSHTFWAGLKAYAVDSGLPVVWKNDALDCVPAGDEHTKLVPSKEGDLAALAHFKVGDRCVLPPPSPTTFQSTLTSPDPLLLGCGSCRATAILPSISTIGSWPSVRRR
jgi:hypothetical protein